MSKVFSSALAFLLGVAAAGCDAEPSPSFEIADVAFPVRKDMNGYPAALADGTLQLIGRCLVVTGPGLKDVILWPPGLAPVKLVGPSVGVASIATGRVLTSIGARILLGGGEISSTDFAQTLTEAGIPLECALGQYWLASDVNPPLTP